MKLFKKVLPILLIVCLCFSTMGAVLAVGDDGKVVIPFTKTWSADNEETRPESIIVTLYKYLGDSFDASTAILVESKTLTAEDGWEYSFDITDEALYSGDSYSSATAYKWIVVEDPVTDYTEAEHTDPSVEFNPAEVDDDGWNRITQCSNNKIDITTTTEDTTTIIFAKKGGTFVCWSAEPLTEAEKQMVFNSAKANVSGLGNPSISDVEFISGYDKHFDFGIKVTTTQIQFDKFSDWSAFALGLYNMSSTTTEPGSITNSYTATGSLTVSKILAGNDVDSTKEFSFTITLSNTDINGTFSGVSFTNGTATITLKGGESKTIEELPAGVGFTVTETAVSGYECSAPDGITGKIDKNTPATAEFTNTRNTYGDLTVTKTVAGNAASTDKEFEFTVTLDDETINGTFGDMTFANGVATFTLKHGDSITAEDLPNDVEYEVVEADYTADGYETTKTGDTGTIVGGEAFIAEFTNTRDKFGSLTISKTVAGDLADKNKEFTFTVEIGADGRFEYAGSKSGVITSGGTVLLKDGESITISGIPAGASYTVTESDNDGYTVQMSGNTGTIGEDTTSEAKFTNIKSSVPKTGDNRNMGLWISLMGMSLAGIAIVMIIDGKAHRKPAHLKHR